MKFSRCFILLLLLSFTADSAVGMDLLSISSVEVSQLQPKNRYETLIALLARFDRAWAENRPHQAESLLDESLAPCSNWLSESHGKRDDVQIVREGYLCLMLESERINRLSPWKVAGAAERLKNFSELVQNSVIPLKEKLYAEGRIYSSLPALYGRDLKRALVALETLRRLENNPKVSVPWIQRIRKIQGKRIEELEEPPMPVYQKRKESDGLPVSLIPVLFANFPQGIGLQIRGTDSALFDTERKIQGRLFATHRGSVGGEIRLEDYQTLASVKAIFQMSYLHGIQEHHGLGLYSPKSSLDLYLDKGTADLAIQKSLISDFYIKLGWRLHSSHLREIRGGTLDSGLEGISNTFDTGLVTEVGFDSRDSETEPYRGHRIFIQSYLPQKIFGSSRSFERWLGLAESYALLNLQTQLKLQGAFCTVSESAPFSWYSQLSGTVPFSGVRPTRFVERSLLSVASELRWKGLSPVTLFGYSNAAVMSSFLKELFNEKMRWGGGIGGEIHLTRFRNRAFRIEAGNFGGEWSFNSMIGVALD